MSLGLVLWIIGGGCIMVVVATLIILERAVSNSIKAARLDIARRQKENELRLSAHLNSWWF